MLRAMERPVGRLNQSAREPSSINSWTSIGEPAEKGGLSLQARGRRPLGRWEQRGGAERRQAAEARCAGGRRTILALEDTQELNDVGVVEVADEGELRLELGEGDPVLLLVLREAGLGLGGGEGGSAPLGGGRESAGVLPREGARLELLERLDGDEGAAPLGLVDRPERPLPDDVAELHLVALNLRRAGGGIE